MNYDPLGSKDAGPRDSTTQDQQRGGENPPIPGGSGREEPLFHALNTEGHSEE